MSGATIGVPLDALELDRLREAARRIRVEVIRAVYHARAGHLGGPLSAADILAALYFHKPDPPRTSRPRRTATASSCSKGHSSIGLFSAMALRGYFPIDELLTFDGAHSRLQGHPDMTRLPGLDMSTGSLGMGISAAMGMALGARLTGRDVRAFVMLGDGECQKGEVWEAANAAPHYRLDNLVAIIDHNRLQQYGWPGDGPTAASRPRSLARWPASGRPSAGASSRSMATTWPPSSTSLRRLAWVTGARWRSWPTR